MGQNYPTTINGHTNKCALFRFSFVCLFVCFLDDGGSRPIILWCIVVYLTQRLKCLTALIYNSDMITCKSSTAAPRPFLVLYNPKSQQMDEQRGTAHFAWYGWKLIDLYSDIFQLYTCKYGGNVKTWLSWFHIIA